MARRHGRAVDDGAGRPAGEHRARRRRRRAPGRRRGDGDGDERHATRARLAEIPLPDFGLPAVEPLLPPTIFAERLRRLRSAMDARGYDHLVVWADREHSANLAYLSGFDPRFEEAVLVVGASGDPAVLVGNECAGMAARRSPADADGDVPGPEPSRPATRRRRHRCARSCTTRGSGPAAGSASSAGRPTPPATTIEAPAFLVDELRAAVATGAGGERDRPPDRPGRRAAGVNEVDQLAAFEWAACQTSRRGARVLTGLQPGHDRARLRPAPGVERRPVVVPPDAHRRPPGAARACSARAIGRSSGAIRSRSPTASGAR